jgi:hypothetical protein
MKTRRFLAVTVGVMVLSVGLVLANYGPGVTPAEAVPPPDNPGIPYQAILDKLDQVLAALTGAAGQNNHTLRWDTNNASNSRFTTAFPGAVLDKNTGLVWEQAPGDTFRVWEKVSPAPEGAINYCVNKQVGGTRGWRLPSVAELASVQDPTLAAPFVPASVFTGVQSTNYWSASTHSAVITLGIEAWGVGFGTGNVIHFNKLANLLAWCVRGPMNADQY